ncbi:MAG: hypothetical protein M3P18_08365, partial [Actinomycetota bacterium]|nr:hypothetical protein [Actinomycetota bacterium]
MPAYPLLRFVNSIAASPTIDLDLNDKAPFVTARADFSAGTPVYGGDPLSVGVKWGYRTLTLTPQAWGSNTTALTAYQALAKQVTQDNLLMVQLDSTMPPVFFKTYKTQPAELDMSGAITDASGRSYYRLSVQLTADHAAYGLPETSTVTISNDPAAGTNKVFYRWPVAVKGDLETPLYLEAPASDVRGQTRLLASQALMSPATQTAPVVVQANTLTHGGAVAGGVAPVGTLVDNTGDAAMSGGTYTRYLANVADTGATTPVSLVYGVNLLPATLVGDYRVLMRVRCGATADVWSLQFAQIAAASPSYSLNTGAVISYTRTTTGPHWLDMGVFRFPFGAPPVDPVAAFDTTYTSPGLSFAILMASNAVTSKTLDFDVFLFVPVGADQALATRYGTTTYDKSLPGATYKAAWNGLTDTRYLLDGSNNYSPGIAPKADGGLPTLTPGADNSIHYLQHIGTGYNDPRTTVTT